MEQEATTSLRLQTTQRGKTPPPKKCKEERKLYQEREGKITREIECEILVKYGFVPDMGSSTFTNVYNIISNMKCSHYFSRPNNLAFHDLTKNKSVPLVAREILGLSTKFIPTKPFTSSAADLEKSQTNFRRDAHLKVFFADNPIDNDPPKLYVQNGVLLLTKSHKKWTQESATSFAKLTACSGGNLQHLTSSLPNERYYCGSKIMQRD